MEWNGELRWSWKHKATTAVHIPSSFHIFAALAILMGEMK